MKTIITVLLVLAVCTLYAQKPKPEKVEKIKVTIQGDNDWLDTGIKLRPQDRVTIEASGQVFFSNGTNSSGVTPDGYYYEHFLNDYASGDYAFCGDPMHNENVNHAALIGKVNKEMFFIGKNSTFGGKDGILIIGINDCSFKGDYYNTGEFNVTIVVERYPTLNPKK